MVKVFVSIRLNFCLFLLIYLIFFMNGIHNRKIFMLSLRYAKICISTFFTTPPSNTDRRYIFKYRKMRVYTHKLSSKRPKSYVCLTHTFHETESVGGNNTSISYVLCMHCACHPTLIFHHIHTLEFSVFTTNTRMNFPIGSFVMPLYKLYKHIYKKSLLQVFH